MELTLFAVLTGIGLILIFLGYMSKEGAYSLLGFSFLFILGFWVLLPGQLALNSGQMTNYTYTLGVLTSTTETPITIPFSDYVSRFFGIWLSICGAIGIAITTVAITRGTPK